MPSLPTPAMIELLMRLPLRKERVWQGGTCRTPAWVDEPGGAGPVRPWFGAWVSGVPRSSFMGERIEPRRWTPEELLDLFLETAIDRRKAGYRPGRLEVAEPALAERLTSALAGSGIEVRLTDRLDVLDDFVRQMGEHFRSADPRPGALDASGVTAERMRSFADAAKRFFEAAPWEQLRSDEDPIAIEAPKPPRDFAVCSVMGSGGLQHGLAFFRSRRDFDSKASGDFDPDDLAAQTAWSVMFEEIAGLPLADADLWEDNDLPVAGRNAYPTAAAYGPGSDVRRPNAATLNFLEALLLTIAEATEEDLDSGRWTKTVRTFDGEVSMTLALPDLLDGRIGRQAGLPLDRRAMERAMVELQRFAAEGEFGSMDELNAAIEKRFVGKPIDEIPSSAVTPAEKAQELCYHAYEARGRLRIRFARQALAIDPECAEAFVILADRAANPERARQLYEKGVAAGERAIRGISGRDPEDLHYWADLRTRPYMRAKHGLAEMMLSLGDKEGALAHFRELLRLNPDDNQGMRLQTLPLLLDLGRDDEARALLEAYPDEGGASWPYARTLLSFRESGDTLASRNHLVDAIKANPYLWKLLVAPEKIAGEEPDSYARGSREEAEIFAVELLPAWEGTPGAVAWLKSAGKKIASRTPPPGHGRPGGRKRAKKGGRKRR